MDIEEVRLSPDLARMVGDTSWPISAAALLGIAGISLLIASVIVSGREYVVAEQV